MSASTQAVGQRRSPDWPKHLAVLILLGMELFPVYMMVTTSVKDNSMFFKDPWLPVGPGQWVWSNFSKAFETITPYVANTVVVALTATVFSLILSIMAAYFFARYKMPFAGFFWGAFLLLMLMPGVANIVPLFALMKELNLINTLWALIILGVAGSQVFSIFILKNFIEDIPRDLFEAAEMDGASHLKQIIHVVIPMSGSIIGTLAILKFLGSWNDFLMPLLLLRDPELFTIGVGLIFLDGEPVKQWGEVMAAFLVASLPLVIIFLFMMRLFVRGLSSGAVKG